MFGENSIQSLGEVVAYAEGKDPSILHASVVPREVRKQSKLTQAKMATLLGMSLPGYRKWEQGTRRIGGPAALLLRVIQKEPEAVRRALLATDSITERFPWNGDLFHPTSGERISLRGGPAIFLRLTLDGADFSSDEFGELDNGAVQEAAWKSLLPLAVYQRAIQTGNGGTAARSEYGAGMFASSGDIPPTALSASVITRQGSFHGVDFQFLGPNAFGDGDGPCVSAEVVEMILIDGLENFLTVAEDGLVLEKDSHFTAKVGLEGIKNLRLKVTRPPSSLDFIGPIFAERVEEHFEVDFYTDPYEALLPFFRKIYDAAGLKRPEQRTLGLSQHWRPAKDRTHSKRPRF